MLTVGSSHESLSESFQWEVPEYYNIGVDVCDRWAEAGAQRLAIIDINDEQEHREISFSKLRSMSNQLANALRSKGVKQAEDLPDRVAILLPQCVETAVAHIAVFKLGAISLPLFTLFGQDALCHRLADSASKVLITNSEGLEKVREIRHRLPDLRTIISVDSKEDDADNLYSLITVESTDFQVVKTFADDPALLIYTSGTTGNPKGVLHAHRALLGHLPGVELSHDFLPEVDDRFWTPADWAWIGGLLDVLMPSLHHGIPVVAYRFQKFDPVMAVELMIALKVRNVFMPPTALKMLKSLPDEHFQELNLRSIGSGGETLGSELLEWGSRVFGLTINEFYGQTECNMIVSSCSALEPPKPGYMGRAVPGHIVQIVDPVTGVVLENGREGAIAVLSPNPVMFLRYWNNPQATADKYVTSPEGRWLLTGDRGTSDEDGRLKFVGRDDDVIASSGYRIGPAEIENSLVSHPAVQLAGVVGKPDELRGNVVVAFVKLNTGYEPNRALSMELSEWVKERLAAHEYPREIRFLSNMPMTISGKIIRAKLREMTQNHSEE